jgi:hypothetical protein
MAIDPVGVQSRRELIRKAGAKLLFVTSTRKSLPLSLALSAKMFVHDGTGVDVGVRVTVGVFVIVGEDVVVGVNDGVRVGVLVGVSVGV